MLKERINSKKSISFKQLLFFAFLAICCIGSIFFVFNNQEFYDRPIAEVVSSTIVQETEAEDMNGNKDTLFVQEIVGIIKNGEFEGKKITLMNEYSSSGAYDQEYQTGKELFVAFDKDSLETGEELRGTIQDVKRDQYLMIIA